MQAEESPLRPGSSVRPAVPGGPYVVLGLGQAGLAAVEALAQRGEGSGILASDVRPAAVPKRVRRIAEQAGARLVLGPQDGILEATPPPRTLIRSPGIPAQDPLLRQARQRGIVVIDELELGWRLGKAPIVAVTGTNGKTTTSTLAAAILGRSGLDARLAGNADIAPPLSAVRGDPDVVVCEVSSFQLEGCPAMLPEVAVFTNLSQDHLPRHGTMRRYGEVKRSLFLKGEEAVRLAVVDTIDGFGRALADEIERAGGRVVRVGVDAEAAYRIRDARWDLRQANVEIDTPAGGLQLRTRLPGDYNARNVAAVAALSDCLGVERAVLAEVLATHPGPRGRFERIALRPRVILDTASSPVAVEQFLAAARAGIEPTARLHLVIGLLGAPDPEQREAIGRAARRLSDRLTLTAGSYRRDPPLATLDPLLAGARSVSGAELTVVPEREEAIAAALRDAAPHDVVAVLGRGNVLEPIRNRKADDRSTLHRLLQIGGNGGLPPERAGETSRRQVGMQFEQRGVGG